MTVVIEPSSRTIAAPRAGQPLVPFLVAGTLCGQQVRKPAASLDEVVNRIDEWTTIDENSTGHWRLHEDYSEPVTIILRSRTGRPGATRRQGHLVRLLPGQRQGLRLTAECGVTLTIIEAEVLPTGVGMPCERCLLDLPQQHEAIW